ncbi:MAG: MATE family efflux transporter [Granulosicoccus sp.]
MSFTASIGLMAIFAVDFIDMIFIGMLGNDALAAAVGYAGTLLFFTNAVNIGLSIAAGSLVAKAIGADDTEAAREHATSVVLFAIVSGLLVPVCVLWKLPWLLDFLGANAEVAQLASRYVWIIMPTMPVMAIGMTAMAVLRANGDARRPMLATLYGGIANAMLDPILIFSLDFGLDGAAMASVVARFTILGFALWPAIRLYDGFARPGIGLIKRDFSAVSAIAVPAVLTNIATPFGSAIVVREMARFGTEAVAGMAVIGRLTPVAFAVIFALSGAIGPIIGQNFGAGNFDRVRGAFFAGIRFIAIYVVVAAALLFALRGPIAGLFDAQGLTLTLIYLFCGPLALASFFNGIIFVANASFNNLGHPVYSTWINWGRHTLGTWPLALAGAALGGAPGVLIGQALGGAVFAIVAWYLVERVMRDLESPLSHEPFAIHRRLHSLICGLRW